MMDKKELKVLKKTIHDEIAVVQEMHIGSYTDCMDAADNLYRLKKVGESIEEREKEITKPLKEALKSAQDLFKPLKEAFADAEAEAKEKYLDYHKSEWNKGENVGNTIAGSEGKATIVERMKAVVFDETKIPKEYMVLVPNIAKIEAELKEGGKVEGAELQANYSLSIAKK